MRSLEPGRTQKDIRQGSQTCDLSSPQPFQENLTTCHGNIAGQLFMHAHATLRNHVLCVEELVTHFM